jgi:hypothetical protein
MIRKSAIHEMVATKPMYTSNSIMPHPRVKIDRRADVASVNGNPTATFLKKKSHDNH